MDSAKRLFGILLLLCTLSCSTSQSITDQERGIFLIKGQTTQVDIIQMFGLPNQIAIAREQDQAEMWTYSHLNKRRNGRVKALTLIGDSDEFCSDFTSSTFFDLVLIFDSNKKVIDYYRVASPNGSYSRNE